MCHFEGHKHTCNTINIIWVELLQKQAHLTQQFYVLHKFSRAFLFRLEKKEENSFQDECVCVFEMKLFKTQG